MHTCECFQELKNRRDKRKKFHQHFFQVLERSEKREKATTTNTSTPPSPRRVFGEPTEGERMSNTSGPAASEWSEHTAPNGKKYYYNSRTRVTTWVIPDELQTREEVNLFAYFSKIPNYVVPLLRITNTPRTLAHG